MNFEVAIYNTLCVDEIRVLNSIKAAYLYADKVRVYDFLYPFAFESFVQAVEKKSKADGKEFSDVAREGIAKLREDKANNRNLLMNDFSSYLYTQMRDVDWESLIDYVSSVKSTNKRAALDRLYNEKIYEKELGRLGIDRIIPFVYPLLGNADLQIKEFDERFRNDTGFKLFNNYSKEHQIKDSSPSILAPSYLSEYAISKLPCFEKASVSEIIDIRDELDRYIVPYRTAIVEMAQEIKNIPDSESLRHECAAIYLNKIEPKVLEINAAVHDNNVIKNIAASIMGTQLDWFDIGAMAIVIAKSHNVYETMLESCIAPLGRAIAGGIKTTLENDERIREENEMYFLYEAGEILMN